MDLQEQSITFLKYFCNGNIDALGDLLSDDFRFSGPFIDFSSKEEYLNSLRDNPPIDCQIEIIKSFADNESVGLFYRFVKPNVNTIMAQYFRFFEGNITESTLIFDTSVF